MKLIDQMNAGSYFELMTRLMSRFQQTRIRSPETIDMQMHPETYRYLVENFTAQALEAVGIVAPVIKQSRAQRRKEKQS